MASTVRALDWHNNAPEAQIDRCSAHLALVVEPDGDKL
jgi:hypothetical protein